MLSKEQTVQICMQELKNYGSEIKYIPIEYITEEMCCIAIENCQYAECVLPYIPNKFYTEKVCMSAIDNHNRAMEYIPRECLSEKICEYAVEHKGYNLRYVPLKFQILKMWETAIDDSGSNLEFVPEDNRSAELCGRAFAKNREAVKYIPEKYITEELCLEAAKANESEKYTKVHLDDIPLKFRTAEVCFQIIKCETRAVTGRYAVPSELVDEVNSKLNEYWKMTDEKRQADWELLQDICHNPLHIKNLTPEQKRRELLCSIAVEQDGVLLRFVPKDMRSLDICEKAVRNDVDSLAYVPEEIKATVIDNVKSSGCLLKILFGESDYRRLFLDTVKSGETEKVGSWSEVMPERLKKQREEAEANGLLEKCTEE